MTYQERIRSSASVHAAMCVLGEAIDKLLGQVPEVTTEPGWDAWQAQPPNALPSSQPAPSTAEADSVRARLATESDADERRALEARLRLLADDAVVPNPTVPEGRRTITTGDDKQIVVDIPAPDRARMQARASMALAGKFGEQLTPPLSNDEAADAYARGGPMWLYMYDRDAVMGMPEDWRRAMVNDVLVDSPAQAHELGRDILKDTTPGERSD